ncbi:hypothetical protein AB0E85_12895 [Streptomyces sp. NPDC029044]|uniref:hypothetical protein n=1 Tax=Streptomyces sp. NPDC029044 TaxID=3157198 RepID=UPI0033FDB65F
MGYSPSLYKFAEGADVPVALDLELVRTVLEPHDVGDPRLRIDQDGALRFWIRADDGGEAEIFADDTGILVERPHSGAVFVILAELASRLGAVALDPSAGRVVCRPDEYVHLPESMRKDAVVIEMTGERLEAALLGRHPA